MSARIGPLGQERTRTARPTLDDPAESDTTGCLLFSGCILFCSLIRYGEIALAAFLATNQSSERSY
jgi:hypothetical protein